MTLSYDRLTALDCYDLQPDASERAKKRQHFPKHRKASDTPHSHALVYAAHADALLLQAMVSRFRGIASGSAVLFSPAWVFWGYATCVMWDDTLREIAKKEFTWALAGGSLAIVSTLAFVAVIIMCIRTLRLDFFAPKETPLVFNRTTRKVYRFVQDVPTLYFIKGWKGILPSIGNLLRYWASAFLPWPRMLLIEYDWDCLEAEYYTQTGRSGSVIRTSHHLDLYVREAPGSDTVIGSFPLAPSLMVGEPVARNVWEHMRRYMEENGPALSPGDSPAQPAPRGFWQAANALFNGPGWLFFIGIAIWLWPETRNEYLCWTQTDQCTLAIYRASLMGTIWKGLIIIPTYFFLTWVFFAIVASYLSPDVPLPAEALAGAGEKLDIRKLAKEAKNAVSVPPNQGSIQHATGK